MTTLVIRGMWKLIRVDWTLRRFGVGAIQSDLAKVTPERTHMPHTPERICRAIDIACVLSVRRVLCLQRSAATVLLLRECGHSAILVIGARIQPFYSHAWVELNGVVINDRPYVNRLYEELARC